MISCHLTGPRQETCAKKIRIWGIAFVMLYSLYSSNILTKKVSIQLIRNKGWHKKRTSGYQNRDENVLRMSFPYLEDDERSLRSKVILGNFVRTYCWVVSFVRH